MNRESVVARQAWRIVPILPGNSGIEWAVSPDRILTIGRSRAMHNAPDINLWPDRFVSRRHASVRQEGNACWLRDAGSKLGTRIEGDRIAPGIETEIPAGASIECGRSRLLLLGPEWKLFNRGPLLLVAELPSLLGYGLAHSGRPSVSQLRVHNTSAALLPAAAIELTLGTFARAATDLPALKGGEAHSVSNVAIETDVEALESVRERLERQWSLSVDGESFCGSRTAALILAHNEILFTPEHRSSWAAFVLPNHPAVTEIATRAAPSMGPSKPSPATVLEAVYRVLHSTWRIRYCDEPPHYDVGAQKVRLPHDVLKDPGSRTGEGTCLDLAMLIAGTLESLGIQPLVAIVEKESRRHALVGCWGKSRLRIEPILLDRGPLLENAVWMNPTGCVREGEQRQGISGARQTAERLLREWELVFALDVSSARQDGILPTPISGEPQWSAPVARALGDARAAASESGGQLSVVCLLVGLLRLSGGSFRKAFAATDHDPDAAAATVAAALPKVSLPTKPSRHYHQVLGASRAAAKADGMALIEERHLVGALLEIRSTALDRALRLFDTSRAALRANLATQSDSADTTQGTASVFPSGPWR